MSKIKPYHEPLEAKTYDLEVSHTTNTSQRETFGSCAGEPSYKDINYHNGESIHSYNMEKQCKFNEGQKIVSECQPHKQIMPTCEEQKWLGPYPSQESMMMKPLRSRPYIPKIWDNGDHLNSYHTIGSTPTKSSLLTKEE